MRAVVFEEVDRVRVDDVPNPSVEEPGDAVVRVTTAAICGSDLHFYDGKAPLLPGEQIGHEGVGVVEQVGGAAEKFAPGDRVVLAFNAESAVDEVTEGRGADVVIEAVGAVPAFRSAIDVVRRGGTICVVGMYVTESTELQLGVAWFRMLNIIFSGVCPIHAWWDGAMEAVAEGKIDPLPIISHTLPLEEAPKGYELFAAREATKVILKP